MTSNHRTAAKRLRTTNNDHQPLIPNTNNGFFLEELLQKFGIAEKNELDIVVSFIQNTNDWGHETLQRGLENMFGGMQRASVVYSEMKSEIQILHQGILAVKKEAREAKDQLIIADSAAVQRTEVCADVRFDRRVLTKQYPTGKISPFEFEL